MTSILIKNGISFESALTIYTFRDISWHIEIFYCFSFPSMFFAFKNLIYRPVVVVYAFNSSTLEAEIGGSL